MNKSLGGLANLIILISSAVISSKTNPVYIKIITSIVSNLNKSISKAHTIAKICSGNVAIQGGRIVLCQHKNLVNSTVDTVAHWDVY